MHPDILPRFNKVVITYKKLSADAEKINLQTIEYLDNLSKWNDRFQNFILSAIKMNNGNEISSKEKKKRIDIANSIGMIRSKYMPEVVLSGADSKKRFEEIEQFVIPLHAAFKTLTKAKKDLQKSNQLIKELEEGYQKQLDNFKIVSERFQYLTSRLEEQKKLYYTIVN